MGKKIVVILSVFIMGDVVYDDSGHHDNSSFNDFLELIELTEEDLLDFTKQFYDINIEKALRG